MILKVVEIETDFEGNVISENVELFQLGSNPRYQKITYTPAHLLSSDKKSSQVFLITPQTKIYEDLIVSPIPVTRHKDWITIDERTKRECPQPMTTKELHSCAEEYRFGECAGIYFYTQEGIQEPFIVHEGDSFLMNDSGKTIERL